MTDIARLALACLDLTRLDEACTEADVDALCARALTPFGPVAAVCVWPRFVARARGAVADGVALRDLSLPPGVTPTLGPDASGVGWVYEYALVDRTLGPDRLADEELVAAAGALRRQAEMVATTARTTEATGVTHSDRASSSTHAAARGLMQHTGGGVVVRCEDRGRRLGSRQQFGCAGQAGLEQELAVHHETRVVGDAGRIEGFRAAHPAGMDARFGVDIFAGAIERLVQDQLRPVFQVLSLIILQAHTVYHRLMPNDCVHRREIE